MAVKTKLVALAIITAVSFVGCSKQAFVLVPSFVQKDVDDARDWARENQITLEINQQPAPPSLGVKPGKIMNQAPNPGSEIQPGDSVIVYVASTVKYDPEVGKANLAGDLDKWPASDSNYNKFKQLMGKGVNKPDLTFDFKTLTKLPSTDYKQLLRSLNNLEIPRTIEGNVAYLSMLNSLNKVVNLQNAADVDPKKLLKTINEFEEQRHLLNQLLQ